MDTHARPTTRRGRVYVGLLAVAVVIVLAVSLVRGSGWAGFGGKAEGLAQGAEGLPTDQREPSHDVEPLQFVVSSFNVLGAGHTGPNGNVPQRPDWDRRLGPQIRMLDANGIDVVGFQEFEPRQYHGFVRRTGNAWGMYPATTFGPRFTRNSIAWRRDVWELVDSAPLRVPYFRGNLIPIPVVLLRHQETGRQVYLINTHNPASIKRRGNNDRWRVEALRRQLAKVRELRRKAPDVPVILMGDFNERLEAYCPALRAGLRAANPGGGGPGCTAPAEMGIDWIFGTSDVRFADYARLRTGWISDHPMIVARATVD